MRLIVFREFNQIVPCVGGLFSLVHHCFSKKEKRPSRPLSLNFTPRGYFGGGVVDSDPFLLFLPPLWLLVLVLLVAFFPEAVDVVAVLSVEPPVAWAKDRLAPSRRVNAIVSSFFIHFLRMRFSCGSLRC